MEAGRLQGKNPESGQTMTVDRPAAIARLTAAGQDYEIVSGEVWGRPCRMFKHAPDTLGDLYASASSDATFLVYEKERYSFEETQAQVARIATVLRARYGIARGDRVAISMRNFPEWVMAFNAVTAIGGVAVAMNALWQTEELEFGLKDCGARVLFADQERLDRLAPILGGLELDIIAVRPQQAVPEGVGELAALLQDTPPCALPQVEVSPEDTATIFYTSGSTGHPKGAESCHRNIVNALMSWELEAQITLLMQQASEGTPNPDEPPAAPEHQVATLLAVPLFHATGSHAVMLASYRAQRKMVCMYKWDAQEAMRLIEQERISSFVAPAAMTGDLVQAARDTSRDLSSLLSVGGGGAPRAPEQVRRIPDAFKNAMPSTGWGMTETNAIGTGISREDYVQHPDSSGRCSAVLDLRVVGEDGTELDVGQRGELQVRGVSVIKGYWARPEANAEAFAGEWLRTGDVACLDEEGYLYIVDRIKDLVIRGGENIGCAEVEAGLLEHPEVLEASVYAVPDERLGEEVGATVYAGCRIDQEALRGFLLARVARFKIPRYLHFSREPLPRIASGKIDKRLLREQFVGRLT